MRRLRIGLVVTQMALSCVLVIAAALLIESFRLTLQTKTRRQSGVPVLATIQARPAQLAQQKRPRPASDSFARSRTRQARCRGDASRVGRDASRRVACVAAVSYRAGGAGHPGSDHAGPAVHAEPRWRRWSFRPSTGRLFGGQDTPEACRVAIVNDVAAREVFGGEAVGRSIDDPSGQNVEIVGVVAMRPAERRRRADSANDLLLRRPDGHPSRGARAGAVSRLRESAARRRNARFEHGFGALLRGDGLDGDGRASLHRRSARRLPRQGSSIRKRPIDISGAAPSARVLIDQAGRRTEIVGVVRAAPARTLQSRIEPAIYLPHVAGLPAGHDADARRAGGQRRGADRSSPPARGGAGPRSGAGGGTNARFARLSRTALAPLRIAATLVGASAATALALAVIGLSGAMTDSARRRRREIAVRMALGAQGWRVIRHVVSEGVRLAAAGTLAGVLGSLLVSRALTRIAPAGETAGVLVWLAGPLVLLAAVAVASVLPASRALAVDPIAVTRVDR